MQKKIKKMHINKIFIAFVLTMILLSFNFFNGSYAVETTKTAKTKSKTITKEEAENSKKILELKSLNIENYELYPEFNSNTTTYYIEIPKTQNSLDINCETNVDEADIKITGNKRLVKNENLIQISLSKSGYESRTYNIYASKKEDNGPKLTSLSIENREITPQFEPNRYYYSVNVNYTGDIKPLNINAVADDDNTTIEIIGNNTDTLIEGDNNIITILLNNSEGSTVYQINATIQKNTIIEINNNNDWSSKISEITNKIGKFRRENKIPLLVASFVVAFIIIILVIIKFKKKKAKENRQKIKDRF